MTCSLRIANCQEPSHYPKAEQLSDFLNFDCGLKPFHVNRAGLRFAAWLLEKDAHLSANALNKKIDQQQRKWEAKQLTT